MPATLSTTLCHFDENRWNQDEIWFFFSWTYWTISKWSKLFYSLSNTSATLLSSILVRASTSFPTVASCPPRWIHFTRTAIQHSLGQLFFSLIMSISFWLKSSIRAKSLHFSGPINLGSWCSWIILSVIPTFGSSALLFMEKSDGITISLC